MKRETRRSLMQAVLGIASLVAFGASFAQDAPPRPPVPSPHGRITLPGTSFTVEGTGQDVRVERVPHGLRVRGGAFSTVFLRGAVRLPAPDAKIEGVAVHFTTSNQGPSLRSVEFRNGSNVEFRVTTLASGDFTFKENFRPADSANAWSFKNDPLKVSSQAVLRLEVKFPGGFDSEINPGEFVLQGVAIDFVKGH